MTGKRFAFGNRGPRAHRLRLLTWLGAMLVAGAVWADEPPPKDGSSEAAQESESAPPRPKDEPLAPPEMSPPPEDPASVEARTLVEAGKDDQIRGLASTINRLRPKDAAVGGVISALDHRDERIRARAVRVLGALKAKDAMVAVKRMLADPAPPVVVAAAEAVRTIMGTKAGAALVPALSHPSVRVRCAVAVQIGKSRDRNGLNALSAALVSNPDAEQKICFATALYKARRKGALEQLVPLLQSPDSRALTVAALAPAGKDALSAVSRSIGAAPTDELVTGAIAVALATKAAGRRWLVAQLGHPALNLQRAVSAALSQLTKDPVVSRELGDVAKKGKPTVRARAIGALAANGDRALLKDARRWLDDPAPEVRAAAARVFEIMPVVADQDRLVRRYQTERLKATDANVSVRVALIRAMGRLKSASLVPLFVDAFAFAGEQQAAVDALVSVGSPAARTLLLVVKVGDMERMPYALEALARLGSGVGSAAQGLFKHPREIVRKLARDLMAASNDPRAVDALLGLFRNESYEDPVPLIEAIATFDSEGARSALIEVLDHRDPRARLAAVAGLGAMHRRDDAVFSALQKVVETDKDVPMKIAAIRALYRLYSPGLPALLARLVQYEGPEVRRACYEVLSWLGSVDIASLISSKVGGADEVERKAIFGALARLTRVESVRNVRAANAWTAQLRASTQRRAQGRRGKLEVDGTTLRYRTAGSGRPLIAVSGFHSGDMFQAALDRLGGTATVVTYDGRGRGQTPLGAVPHSLEREVADIEALRKALKAEKVSLLGHDTGGLIALAYAKRHPDHVDGVILVSTPPKTVRYGTSNVARRLIPSEYVNDIAELDSKHAWFSPEAWLAYRHVALTPGFVADPKHAPRVAAFPVSPTAQQLVEGATAGLDAKAMLKALPVKTAVILGEKAALTSLERGVYQGLARSGGNVSFQRLDGLGHYPHLEDPGRFASEVSRALSAIR